MKKDYIRRCLKSSRLITKPTNKCQWMISDTNNPASIVKTIVAGLNPFDFSFDYSVSLLV